jgi:hypothetical protein
MQDGREGNLNINCSVNYHNVLFSPSFSETFQPAVYISTIHGIKSITFAESNEIGLKLNEKFPLNNIMWKPSVTITKYREWH